MIFKWQMEQWGKLVERLERLPHALLFAGPPGIGKRVFATTLAQRLLCGSPDAQGLPCGKCAGCRWYEAGNHPDYRLVAPGSDEAPSAEEGEETEEGRKASRQIRIEQVRALGDWVGVGTHQGGRRVILIDPAEAMNAPTANALLKLLEEPPISTQFLLISHEARRLLPTIRSRCQVLTLGRPDAKAAQRWLADDGVADAAAALAFAGGAPLAARDAAREEAVRQRERFGAALAQGTTLDALALAGECEGWLRQGADEAFSLARFVDWMQKWLYDLHMVRAGQPPQYWAPARSALSALAGRASPDALADCYNHCLKLKPVTQHPLNPRLFLEDTLIRYVRAVSTRAGA